MRESEGFSWRWRKSVGFPLHEKRELIEFSPGAKFERIRLVLMALAEMCKNFPVLIARIGRILRMIYFDETEMVEISRISKCEKFIVVANGRG